MTGRLDLKKPCKNCPFADTPHRIVFANSERAAEIAELAYRQGFPCHLSATLDEDDEDAGYEFGPNTQHCAGAIGTFLNDGQEYGWPGVDNEPPPGDWSEAQRVAFQSEEDFIAANAADAGPWRHGK